MLLHNLPIPDRFLGQVARPFPLTLPLPPNQRDQVRQKLVPDLSSRIERIIDQRSRLADNLPSLKEGCRCGRLRAEDLGGVEVVERDGVEIVQFAAWEAVDFSNW